MDHLIVGVLCVLLYLASEKISKLLVKFWSDYPLIRLLPNKQLSLRPSFIRAGALVILAIVVGTYWLSRLR